MKTIKILLLFIIVPSIISCSGYGKKLEFNKTEVFYTSDVTKEEAQKLGAYLVRSEFADGIEKSVQLAKNKTSNNYIFRMVTSDEAANNEIYETIFRLMAQQLSDSVFNGKPVDFHVCDNTFKTLKELNFSTE